MNNCKKSICYIPEIVAKLGHMPAEMKGIYISNFFDSLGFMILIPYLALFMEKYIGLSDFEATTTIALSVTLGGSFFFAVMGSVVDKKGIKWALAAGSVLMVFSRILYFAGIYVFPLESGYFSVLNISVIAGIILSLMAAGMIVPARYAAIAEFGADKKTKTGFSTIFAIYNLAILIGGIISIPIINIFGFTAPFFAGVISTVLALFSILYFFKNYDLSVKENNLKEKGEKFKSRRRRRLSIYLWFRKHPLGDFKFLFYILCSIPLTILISQFWYSLPQYVTRAIPAINDSEMMFYLFSLNSLFLIIMVPVFAYIFAKKNALFVVFWGSLIISISPLFLVFSATRFSLLLFILILSAGQALWQPRFMESVTVIAPPEKMGLYIGASQIPANLAQLIAGVIGGLLITDFCPGSENTEYAGYIWLVFLIITLLGMLGIVIWKIKYKVRF